MNGTGAFRQPRIARACEGCRVDKLRCQPSDRSGICKRCLACKRECIVKAGQRKRRSRAANYLPEQSPRESKSFTIHVPTPTEDDSKDPSEMLRKMHELSLENLVPTEEENIPKVENEIHQRFSSNTSLPIDAVSPSKSQTSNSGSTLHSMNNLAQFNIDSASALLEVFRGMLLQYPCVVIPEDATVSSLARQSPFLLLAILSASSGNQALRGHSLYDEEFRKVLGLKYVVSGERTLELLQGLVVYCAWYPFHLRPRNKRPFQYIRMMVDIVCELELDQEENGRLLSTTPIGLERMRTLLATYHLTSSVKSFSTAWKKPLSLKSSTWISKCCEALEQQSALLQDRVLACLVRLQQVIEEVTQNLKASEYQGKAPRAELEASLERLESGMSPKMKSTPAITIAVLSSTILLSSAALLKYPSRKTSKTETVKLDYLDASYLASCIPHLRSFFKYITTLSDIQLMTFSNSDWGSFIICVVIGFRLSFPIPFCPEWDFETARQKLNFGEILAQLCADGNDGPQEHEEEHQVSESERTGNINAVSAMRIVLVLVKKKYDARSARHAPCGVTDAQFIPQAETVNGCPMLNGSMEPFLTMWDEGVTRPEWETLLNADDAGSGLGLGDEMASAATKTVKTAATPVMYHDLWATMTMSWGASNV